MKGGRATSALGISLVEVGRGWPERGELRSIDRSEEESLYN